MDLLHKYQLTYLRGIILSALLLILGSANAQTKFTFIDTVKVYFDTDQSIVKSSYLNAILQMKNRYKAEEIESITLGGHTDSRASDLYNIDLSKRRVDAVQAMMDSMGFGTLVVQRDYMGESLPAADNSTDDGMQENRRVDVIFVIVPYEEVEEEIVEIEEDTCTTDTTLWFDGCKITMNICDYNRAKACMNIVTYTSPQDLFEAGINTISSTGSPLISAGMFNIQNCTNACIKVKMPVPSMGCTDISAMSLWSLTPEGMWKPENQELEKEKENDTLYYSFEICGSGFYNCDMKPPLPPKYKIKAKGGLKLLSATISINDPLFCLTDTRHEPFKKAVISAPCPCKTAYLSAQAINKNGDTLDIILEPINRFKHRKWFKGCKVKERSRFLFFKFHDKSLYRKYILKPKDFESSTPRWRDL